MKRQIKQQKKLVPSDFEARKIQIHTELKINSKLRAIKPSIDYFAVANTSRRGAIVIADFELATHDK